MKDEIDFIHGDGIDKRAFQEWATQLTGRMRQLEADVATLREVVIKLGIETDLTTKDTEDTKAEVR